MFRDSGFRVEGSRVLGLYRVRFQAFVSGSGLRVGVFGLRGSVL